MHDANNLVERRAAASPLISFCIPHWNRTDYLLAAPASIFAQDFRDFEICISDDCSPDGRSKELIDALTKSTVAFAYKLQPTKLRYDGNIRAAIGLALGTYCFLARQMATYERVGVVFTNYQDARTGQRMHRTRQTQSRGSGAAIAVRNFRNYSFVSGVLLRAQTAQEFATKAWDGSEMYQTHIATKIVASGWNLIGIADSVISKDLPFGGLTVGEREARTPVPRASIKKTILPLRLFAATAWDAVQSVDQATGFGGFWALFRQMYLFPYCHWLVQRKRQEGLRAAISVVLGMSPHHTTERLTVPARWRVPLYPLFWLTSALALATPTFVYATLQPWLHRLSKRYRQD